MISGESSCEQKQRAAVTNLNLRSSHNPSPERKTQYETPALSDLQRLVWSRGGSDNHVDQVWPNLYLGDAWAARSKSILQSLGITHILNAADGPYNINTGARYYRDLPIQYYGVQAFDNNSFDISVFFREAADFIHKALNTAGGKVIVHCARGLSRSSHFSVGVLDDSRKPDPCGSLEISGLSPRHLSKHWIPQPAPSLGHQIKQWKRRER